ncbi:MAG: tRNA 2-selenouridine(34) synthase MnmH [Verrucomicrobiaceae bacterium]
MELPERVSLPLDLDEFHEIIDVRAPAEFREDHLPGAINLPVLSDEERHHVGLLHAQDPFAARRLGATLITKNIHHHLEGYLANKPRDYAPLIYCWRGNLRSQSMALIFRSIGWRSRVIEGGYKAWRKWLITDLKNVLSREQPPLIVLAGLTGCGKTKLLHALKEQGAQVLDLEGHANHKGSILGDPATGEQPGQKAFERKLWQDFRHYNPDRPVFTEAESNRIGSLHCPGPLWKRLREAEVIKVSLPLPDRARFLASDYPHFLDDPDRLKTQLDGLRRLRGHGQVDRWHTQIDSGDWTAFLESILVDHYDLVYRDPGSEESVYLPPSHQLSLPAFTSTVFEEAATSLIAAHDPHHAD